ncbi:MAG: secondary thiamine-phosphate synthase enzyme YjbQ [Opitutales bacterium]
MSVYQTTLTITTNGKGTYEFTGKLVAELKESGLEKGVLTVFCKHTSCSLVIMENADPTARADLEVFFDKLVPEDDPDYAHVQEGPDDMPSHIKMALTRTAETIPFSGGKLSLGTWQGVYLWEHRRYSHTRSLVLCFHGE